MRTGRTKLLWLPLVAILVSCAPEEKSPIVQKLETSELHELGTSCAGTFFAFDGKNLVMVEKGKSEIILENVTFEDIGNSQVTMTAHYSAARVISRFHLNRDKTVMNYETMYVDPHLTPEQLARLGLKPDYEANIDRQMSTMPPLVLCPKPTS
ncbi:MULTISPECIES: hypothetical protein [unclassified Rhizobium]